MLIVLCALFWFIWVPGMLLENVFPRRPWAVLLVAYVVAVTLGIYFPIGWLVGAAYIFGLILTVIINPNDDVGPMRVLQFMSSAYFLAGALTFLGTQS